MSSGPEPPTNIDRNDPQTEKARITIVHYPGTQTQEMCPLFPGVICQRIADDLSFPRWTSDWLQTGERDWLCFTPAPWNRPSHDVQRLLQPEPNHGRTTSPPANQQRPLSAVHPHHQGWHTEHTFSMLIFHHPLTVSSLGKEQKAEINEKLCIKYNESNINHGKRGA